jgi:hypothetical protein
MIRAKQVKTVAGISPNVVRGLSDGCLRNAQKSGDFSL